MDDVAQPQLPPPDAHGWRPIASAPLDDCILLTGADGGLYMGFWQRERGRWMTGHTAGPLVVYLALNPTHWMPMLGRPL